MIAQINHQLHEIESEELQNNREYVSTPGDFKRSVERDQTPGEIDKKTESSNEDLLQCKECNFHSETMPCHRSHIRMMLPKKYTCKDCNEMFQYRYHLEEHIVNMHKKDKLHECSHCETRFLTKWRLNKHENIHKNGNVSKTCHYYNNNKQCPFILSGCKFLHKDARKCKYSENCTFKLCKFKH